MDDSRRHYTTRDTHKLLIHTRAREPPFKNNAVGINLISAEIASFD